MSKRTVRSWAKKQYAGDVQPWPRWVRWSLAAGIAVIVVLKIAGVI